MTLSEIKALLVTADADIRHYFSKNTADAYTYWEETQRLPVLTDDKHEELWKFYVHRYTKTEDDTIAQTIFSTLDGDPRVTVRWVQGGYDRDSGYLHHIFECEG